MKFENILEEKFQFKPKYNFKKLADHNNHAWGIILGTYLGYSTDSIGGFLKRAEKIEKLAATGMSNYEMIDKVPFPESPFSETGFVPFGKDLKLSSDEVLALINKRRFHNEPLSLDNHVKLPSNIYDIVDNLSMTNRKFHNKIIRNIKTITKRISKVKINLEQYKIS